MKTYSFSEPFIPDPIWVSPDGNDETGDGTQERPFRQIQTAIDKLPSTMPDNRDTYSINVEGGTYNKIRIRNKIIDLTILDDISIYSTNKNETAFDITKNSILELKFITANKKISVYNFEICIACTYNSLFRIPNNRGGLFDLIFNNENIIDPTNIKSFFVVDSTMNNMGISLNITNDTSISKLNSSENMLFSNAASTSNIQLIDYDTYNSFSNSNLYNFFMASNFSSQVRIWSSPGNLTIGNNYDVGLYTNGGIINIHNIINNATVPTSQINGGRIFMGNTTEIRQTLNDANMSEEEILRLEKILSESEGY